MWVDVDQGPYLKAVLLLAGILAGPAPLQAQAENGWIGKRVITQIGTVLRVGNQVVDDEGRGKELARGKNQNVFRTYLVEQANGSWLWLVAEGSGVKGWAPAANVILFDQAIDYITNQIRANPGAASNYLWRANVWSARKEFDIAIADLNEAIRLDPGDALAYNNRGIAWRAKKDYDKAIADYNEAIADYNEAIRLDPGDALAYYNRGNAWHAKKDYDKAIADYNEAIRLDPGIALAFNNRGNAWRAKKDHDKAIADYNEAIRLDPAYAWAYSNNRGNAWRAKKDYDKAIADYNEAIRLDPAYAWAYSNRGVVFLLTGSEKAGDDERKFLELEGWRGEHSQYAVLWATSDRAGPARRRRRGGSSTTRRPSATPRPGRTQ